MWIDFFRNRSSPQTARLAEVLQGTDRQRDFDRLLRLLRALPCITISSPAIAVQAAQNFRALRAKGITVRKTIDCLIATRCIADGLVLLYSDRDFDPFVAQLGLESAMGRDLTA